MKKNFFKKLSFILAFAMIVTALAPASGVFAAAKQPKLNATSKTLHLGGITGANKFDFNIANKQKGWKYLWKSSNASVVSVNKSNGLATAKGAGTATISVVISDKKGEEVETLKASVLVRDNIKELTITNKPDGDKLAVGEERDFNRSYKTEAGLTKGSQAITRWSVVNKDGKEEGATISDSGLFVANTAGEYTITARAFQSKAKYKEWLSSKADKLVTASTTYTVKVAPSMVKAEQVDLNTFKVTFDSPMTDVASKLAVSYLAGTTKIKQTIKAVSMSADNKVATVDMYVDFTKGSGVVVDYPDLGSVQFIAATTKVEDVVSMEITTSTVEIHKPKTIGFALYNKDGVNIANDDLLSRVTLDSSSSLAYLAGKELTMYKVGETTTINAVFHTWNYDKEGKEIGAIPATKVITCVEKSVATLGTISDYTLTSLGSAPNWKDAKHTIAADDGNLQFHVRLKGKEADGTTDKYTTFDPLNPGLFTFESSDRNILIINNYGVVYPAKEGTANIVVSYDGVVVDTAAVTVTGQRRLARFDLDNTSFTLSNDPDVQDSKTVKLTVKDQLDSDYARYTVNISLTNQQTDKGLLRSSTATAPFIFDATGVDAGTYNYLVTVKDTVSNISMTRNINVTVAKPTSDAVAYYALEPNTSEVDLKIGATASDYKKTVTLSLYAYASNNVKNNRIDLSTGASNLKVIDPENKVYTLGNGLTVDGKDVKIELVSLASGGIISTLPTGTYKVSATVTGAAINPAIFRVENNQEKPVVNVNKQVSDKYSVVDAINDCITITLHGDTVKVQPGDYVDAYNVDKFGGKTAYIKEVYIYESVANGAAKIKHTVAIGRSIDLKR